MSQGTEVKIACLDDSVHLFVHQQSRVEDDAQQLDVVHDRHTRIADIQTCAGRKLHELLSCVKCDHLGLASIEQQPTNKELASHFLDAHEQPRCVF